MTIKIGSMFSGIGCFELGIEAAIPNSETAWQIEIDPFARSILNKHWPRTKKYEDVRNVNGRELEKTDIVCLGFPCTDISIASNRGKGLGGPKSGLWFEARRIISEMQHRPILFIENVPNITIRSPGLDAVLYSLWEIGYDAEWIHLSASDMGAPHKRERIWLIAYSDKQSRSQCRFKARREGLEGGINAEASNSARFKNTRINETKRPKLRRCRERYLQNPWEEFPIGSPICGRNDGFKKGIHRTKRLRALGNSIVPQCAYQIAKTVFESGLIEKSQH